MTLGGVNTGVCAAGGTACIGAEPDGGVAPDPEGPLDPGPEAAAPVEGEPPAPEPLPTAVSPAAETDAGPVAWPALELAGAEDAGAAGGRGDGIPRGAGWGAATRGDAGERGVGIRYIERGRSPLPAADAAMISPSSAAVGPRDGDAALGGAPARGAPTALPAACGDGGRECGRSHAAQDAPEAASRAQTMMNTTRVCMIRMT
jgi:hypothetical protein